jgi:hypothetical protein
VRLEGLGQLKNSMASSRTERAISLYSSKIVDKEKTICIVPNTGIYCYSDKVGTVSLV